MPYHGVAEGDQGIDAALTTPPHSNSNKYSKSMDRPLSEMINRRRSLQGRSTVCGGRRHRPARFGVKNREKVSDRPGWCIVASRNGPLLDLGERAALDLVDREADAFGIALGVELDLADEVVDLLVFSALPSAS